jgi:hypothetical protein
VRQPRRHPSWTEIGRLSGGLKGRVVRSGKQDDATQRLTWSAVEVRRRYRLRAQREALMRACQAPLGLARCQARSARAQQPHIAGCLRAVCGLARERHERQLSRDKLKRLLSFTGPSYALPALERLKRAA